MLPLFTNLGNVSLEQAVAASRRDKSLAASHHLPAYGTTGITKGFIKNLTLFLYYIPSRHHHHPYIPF